MNSRSSGPNWTVIATYSSAGEAYIAKGLLEANEIPAELNNATISSVYPMTDTWAPLELMVPDHLAEQALALISDSES